jgi:16S rRNA (cytosine967-C5)-methyltransferase
LSSQKSGLAIPAKENEKWWDCCCGAGGKSLLLSDTVNNIHITASDKRESIIANFTQRLSKNTKNNIELLVIDLQQSLPDKIANSKFDGIIADVPCSGSGTWARTPEKLTSATLDLESYEVLQKSILLKVLPVLKSGGKLIYITCSVFRAENEAIVEWLKTHMDLIFLTQETLIGIDSRSDSMFYAIFENK